AGGRGRPADARTGSAPRCPPPGPRSVPDRKSSSAQRRSPAGPVPRAAAAAAASGRGSPPPAPSGRSPAPPPRRRVPGPRHPSSGPGPRQRWHPHTGRPSGSFPRAAAPAARQICFSPYVPP
ncbi:ribosome silencing factor, partial [Dysosmobacter welbionis]